MLIEFVSLGGACVLKETTTTTTLIDIKNKRIPTTKYILIGNNYRKYNRRKIYIVII